MLDLLKKCFSGIILVLSTILSALEKCNRAAANVAAPFVVIRRWFDNIVNLMHGIVYPFSKIISTSCSAFSNCTTGFVKATKCLIDVLSGFVHILGDVLFFIFYQLSFVIVAVKQLKDRLMGNEINNIENSNKEKEKLRSS